MWFREKRRARQGCPDLSMQLVACLMNDALPGSELAPESSVDYLSCFVFFFFKPCYIRGELVNDS